MKRLYCVAFTFGPAQAPPLIVKFLCVSEVTQEGVFPVLWEQHVVSCENQAEWLIFALLCGLTGVSLELKLVHEIIKNRAAPWTNSPQTTELYEKKIWFQFGTAAAEKTLSSGLNNENRFSWSITDTRGRFSFKRKTYLVFSFVLAHLLHLDYCSFILQFPPFDILFYFHLLLSFRFSTFFLFRLTCCLYFAISLLLFSLSTSSSWSHPPIHFVLPFLSSSPDLVHMRCF